MKAEGKQVAAQCKEGFPSELASLGLPWGFPGGPVVKILPPNAKGSGLVPGPGTKIPHAVECSQKFFKTNFKKSEMTVP